MRLLAQVWYSTSKWNKVTVKRVDLATSGALRATIAEGTSICCLHLDAANRVWAGTDAGTIIVYAESSATPLCAPLKITPSTVS